MIAFPVEGDDGGSISMPRRKSGISRGVTQGLERRSRISLLQLFQSERRARSETGCRSSAFSATSRVLAKSSRSVNDRFVIPLHSPSGVIETGLHLCPPEKKARKLARKIGWDTSPVRFERGGRGITAISNDSQRKAAGFIGNPDCVAVHAAPYQPFSRRKSLLNREKYRANYEFLVTRGSHREA